MKNRIGLTNVNHVDEKFIVEINI